MTTAKFKNHDDVLVRTWLRTLGVDIAPEKLDATGPLMGLVMRELKQSPAPTKPLAGQLALAMGEE